MQHGRISLKESTSQSCHLQRYAATQHSALPIERLSQCTLFTYICLIALTLPSQIPQLFVVTWNCDGSPRHVGGTLSHLLRMHRGFHGH